MNWAGGFLLLGILSGIGYLRISASREPSVDVIRAAVAQKRWGDVENGLRRWVSRHPRDGDAWEMLGGLLFDQGRIHEALMALRRLRESDRGFVHAQTLIGEIAVTQRNLPAAERAFRNAARRDETAVEPLKRLVSLLVLERRSAEAWTILRKLSRNTRDPRYLADSILLSQTESEFHDLSQELKDYLAQTPDDPWLGRVWGLYLLSRGRPGEARSYLEAAACAFDNDPIGRFALAECRISLGTSAMDLSILDRPPSRGVDAARWWVLRSRLAEAWGKDDEALDSLQHAVAADSASVEAHYRLGQALIRKGDRGKAKAHLEEAALRGGREDNLRRELKRGLRESFDSGSLMRIGSLCESAGLTAEARNWFALAVERDPRSRPRKINPGSTKSMDDRPTVALSCPVLKVEGRPRPPDSSLHRAARPDCSPAFQDVAERVGIHFQYNCGATPNLFIGDTMGGGVALLDFDGDGWLDIYFVNGCRLPFDQQSPPKPNVLFRNKGPDGSFENVTERAGVAGRGYGMGCAVGDFDNDGHDDLFVTGLNQTLLYRNRGNGTFEDVTRRAGVFSSRWTTAAGFADLDGDGDLDLVVVTYVEADPEANLECHDSAGRPIHCQPERFPAQPDQLFRNNGDGTFTDISREAGIELPDGKGLGLAIADFDGDGRLDIFVANDGTPNFLFLNRGRLRFDEVGLAAGIAYDDSGIPTASMGVVAEDLNGDARIDLFHTNFINQTNTLRWNLGNGQFAVGTLAANLAAASRSKTGFGAVALDVENDGTLDLFVANGHTDDQPWTNIPMAQSPQLFLGRDGGRFELAGPGAGPYFARELVGRGAAAGDLDNDGNVDLVVVHRDGPAAVLRNRTRGGHFLGVRLRGTRSGNSPIGAKVLCRVGSKVAVRWLTSGTSYLSSSDPRLWFGLGSAVKADRLEVHWPSGSQQEWSDLRADRILDLREGDNRIRQYVYRRSSAE
jgi:tetratricopeptide (TPR) repeat protein